MRGFDGMREVEAKNVGHALVCPARDSWPVRRYQSMMVSQCGQDAFLDHNYFAGQRGGVYLDMGCNDGRSNSNTFYFAKYLNWYGKCFEADPSKFQQISRIAGRSDGVHGAISTTDGTADFGIVNVPDGGLSGLASTLDLARGRSFGRIRAVSVPTVTPRTILRTYYDKVTTLDYVSLDVEGHELETMRAWPFKHGKWCVSLFSIENNHWCNATKGILPVLLQLMPEYDHVRSIGPDEIFRRRVPCPSGLRLTQGKPMPGVIG